jgi:hypothetical protein
MSNTQKVIVGAIAVIFLAIVSTLLTTSYVNEKIAGVYKSVAPQNYGAAVSPNTHSFFNAGSTDGGVVAQTIAAATLTTSAATFNGTPTVWAILPNINTTISLSSTSTFAYVPKVGDVANIYVRNASSTTASTITFAAVDANLDLQRAEATGSDLVLNGTDWAKMTFIRTSSGLVTAIFDEMIHAD